MSHLQHEIVKLYLWSVSWAASVPSLPLSFPSPLITFFTFFPIPLFHYSFLSIISFLHFFLSSISTFSPFLVSPALYCLRASRVTFLPLLDLSSVLSVPLLHRRGFESHPDKTQCTEDAWWPGAWCTGIDTWTRDAKHRRLYRYSHRETKTVQSCCLLLIILYIICLVFLEALFFHKSCFQSSW